MTGGFYTNFLRGTKDDRRTYEYIFVCGSLPNNCGLGHGGNMIEAVIVAVSVAFAFGVVSGFAIVVWLIRNGIV
jgi:hypothetical protein